MSSFTLVWLPYLLHLCVTKPKDMKKIEQIASLLMKKGISFEYSKTCLTVKGDFDAFYTATYHNSTKELILMDGYYNKVEIETAVQALKNHK